MNSGVAEVVLPVQAGYLSRLKERIHDYTQLSKPRIVLLFMMTGIAAMVVEGSLLLHPLTFVMNALGILLTAASANALNQYFDRDIDAVMERTRVKRPLPQGRLTPEQALIYSISTGVLSLVLLLVYGNAATAFLGLFTIAFYVGIYTLWLKRRTPHNIVIGGAAGATAPLMGWAAATGHVSLTAVALFLLIFLWTPPHFWALALCIKDEYAQVSVPMLPVVAGEAATRRQILLYSLTLPCVAVVPYFAKDCGKLYFAAAVILSLEFVRRAIVVYKTGDRTQTWRLFGYSIAYLLLLVIIMIIDAFLK